MPTDPLTGSRYPASSASPNVAQDIQNAVYDLADNTVTGPHASTAARDSAYAAWVSAGNAMREGLFCYVTGVGLQEYYGGAWSTVLTPSMYPKGIVPAGYTSSGTATATSGTAEQRLSGGQNLAVTLTAGRTYCIECIGDIEASGPTAGAILELKIRGANNATPTTSSKIVAASKIYVATSGAAGEVGFKVTGRFQVGVTASWQLHLFGAVLSVATSLTVTPDSRGLITTAVVDEGPAATGLLSL